MGPLRSTTARDGWWLRSLLVCITALAAGEASAAVASPIAVAQITQIAPGVYAHIGALDAWGVGGAADTANSGFVVGGRCVAVIDPGGTPDVGRALRAAVARTTPLPVCFVIETHAHPDHVLGSVAFAEGSASPPPKFVAAARFAQTLSAREPYYLKALQRDLGLALTHAQIIYPSVAVETTREIDLGDRTLLLRAWPTAHTDNDLTVFDRQTKTLFAGDLLFVQHLPAVDGSLRGWVALLPELERTEAAIVVPGHGPVSREWPAVAKAQSDYLNGLLRDTREAIREGRTIQQAIDRIAAPKGWLLTEQFHRRNVTAAYAELEWEEDNPAIPSSAPAPGAEPARKGRTP
jgi:quinoprotein relay system zinc metallohydrolase 2